MNFHVSSVTGGTDALGDVVVQIDVDGRRVTGRGVATDVVEASARAYLAAVNRALQVAVRAREATERGHAVTPCTRSASSGATAPAPRWSPRA